MSDKTGTLGRGSHTAKTAALTRHRTQKLLATCSIYRGSDDGAVRIRSHTTSAATGWWAPASVLKNKLPAQCLTAARPVILVCGLPLQIYEYMVDSFPSALLVYLDLVAGWPASPDPGSLLWPCNRLSSQMTLLREDTTAPLLEDGWGVSSLQPGRAASRLVPEQDWTDGTMQDSTGKWGGHRGGMAGGGRAALHSAETNKF